MISKSTLDGERQDYEKQIAEAQQQVHTWQQKLLLANGALQAIQALLAQVDEQG